MLSSLISLLRALWQTLSGRPAAAAMPELPQPTAAMPEKNTRPAIDDSICGLLEMSYRRDTDQGLQTQSLWIRIDTRKLMDRILENPDIDLDALQGIERRGSGPAALPEPPLKPAPAGWQRSASRITQAPPTSPRPSARRRGPPSSTHH